MTLLMIDLLKINHKNFRLELNNRRLYDYMPI